MMDGVQKYECVIIVLSIIAGLGLHGHPKEGVHDFRWTFVGLIFSLPPIGRIFGWW